LFENLFRNAVEHGGSDVTITVGALPDGFYVEDDGDGFPEGAASEVFDAGFTTAADGTGFGLAIVSEIVEAHDWSIEATEGTDGGARFEIHTDTD
jgi:signal transduction histidine kinase